MLNYENVVETTSDTDDEDSFGGAGGGAEEEEAGSPAGVPIPEASPRVGHALLSHRDQEDTEGSAGFKDPHSWRHLGESCPGLFMFCYCYFVILLFYSL